MNNNLIKTLIMKTRFISLIALSIFTLTSEAQDCSTGRYLDYVFTGSNKTADIQYGQNINLAGSNEILLMDVYEPIGDTMAERPLIIWAHGGSFIGGSKTGTDVVPLAEDFAKMGYVTASIDYRLGMNGIPFPGPDSVDATETVIRAVHDARAAVRFFKKDYTENGNIYGIDTNNIFFGGVSAGGVTAAHLAYLDNENELPTNYIDTSQAGLGGGIEGNSGNPGYKSNVKAIINSAGALRDTAWMEAGSTPIISFHGDADATVPYGTDIIKMLGVFNIMMVDGSSSIHERAENLGMIHCFEPWPGQGHVPHVGDAVYYDTLATMSKNFLYQFVCGGNSICSYFLDTTGAPANLNPLNDQNYGLTIYPNPSSNEVQITLKYQTNKKVKIELYDSFGKLVRSYQTTSDQKVLITKNELANGLYFVNLISGNIRWTGKIIFE